jgi:hypothetical protein
LLDDEVWLVRYLDDAIFSIYRLDHAPTMLMVL